MRLLSCVAVLAVAVFVRSDAAHAAAVRVVSQTVGTDEFLLAVAEPEQIAALSHLATDVNFSAVAEEAQGFPRLGRADDAEAILAFRPTHVLFTDFSRSELVAQMRKTDVTVIVFDRYETLDDAYSCLRLLARELGTEKRAEAVIAECEERVRRLRNRLAGARPVRVIAPSTYGVIPGAKTTFQDLCDFAVAENLAATIGGLVGHAEPPLEQMLTWPVEMVVVAGASLEEALAPLRQIPPYAFMPAVQEGRAALLKPYQLSCVSHLRIRGYERLARELHPEAFR